MRMWNIVIHIHIHLFLQKKVVVEIVFSINIGGAQSEMAPFMKKKIYAQYTYECGRMAILLLHNYPLAR